MSTKITKQTVEEYLEFLSDSGIISDYDKKLHLFKDAVFYYCNNPDGNFKGIQDQILYFKGIGSFTPVVDEVLGLLAVSNENAREVAKLIASSENTTVTPFELLKLQMRLEKVESVIAGIRESVS